MNKHIIGYMTMAAAIGIVAAAGCRRSSESDSSEAAGPAERTGAALDRAAERTAEAARATGAAVKDVAGQVVERTGEGLESAGGALESVGSGMQDPAPDKSDE